MSERRRERRTATPLPTRVFSSRSRLPTVCRSIFSMWTCERWPFCTVGGGGSLRESFRVGSRSSEQDGGLIPSAFSCIWARPSAGHAMKWALRCSVHWAWRSPRVQLLWMCEVCWRGKRGRPACGPRALPFPAYARSVRTETCSLIAEDGQSGRSLSWESDPEPGGCQWRQPGRGFVQCVHVCPARREPAWIGLLSVRSLGGRHRLP